MQNDKQKILIIDDAPVNIHILNETLKHDYAIFFSINAVDVFKQLPTIQPDLILLDVMMPDIDGFEVCRRLKNDVIYKDIPVIFITALEQIQHETEGLELGAVDYITKPFNPQIVKLRIKNHLELKKQRDILAKLTLIDGLTGINNRRFFDEHLTREWLRAVRALQSIAILMIDIDYFKLYNDHFGHVAGDECLKNVASAIKNTLKRPADIVARYGGEEFVCLLPDTDLKGAVLISESILEAIRLLNIPHPISPVKNRVTVSIGISASFADTAYSPDVLLSQADQALYKAKSEGRNIACTYDSREVEQTSSMSCVKPISGMELKNLLMSFLEENPHPVLCIRSDGTVLYVNKVCSELFQNWDCNVGSFIPEDVLKLVASKDASNAVEVTYNKRIYSFTITALKNRDAVFLYGTDITDKKEAEQKLKNLTKVIEESINIVFITDYHGNIEFVNSTFEKITGYSRQEAIGKNPRILASGETSKANYENLWNTILAGRTWRGIFKNKKKNGEIYWANGFISPIKNDEGKISQFMAIQEDITEKMHADAKLRYLSTYDSITQIFNRTRFVEMLSEALANAESVFNSAALLQVNIDAFKLINDSYGHSIGDQFLKNFAQFLSQHIKEQDMTFRPVSPSILGRLGGDEFAIFLYSRNENEAFLTAESIRRKVENYRFLNDMIRATVSIGIAMYPEHGKLTAELLAKANSATNTAKELGQNRCYLYKTDSNYLKTASSSLEEKQAIITAMEEDRFIPYFQPILDLKKNSIHHYEALARMLSPKGEIVLPSAFIFTAERYGLISGIDKIITYKTMQIQAELYKLGKTISFSMNLSGKHLGDEAMLQYLKTAIDETNAVAECIVFELTETAAISDFARAVDFVKELQSMGCKFSLDDFGVGFTSFVHLVEMDVDFIKIDGSFIRNLPERDRDKMLVKTIAEMARNLDIKTIAEFVDRNEILSVLRDFGVDYAQGYIIGKPQPHLIS